MDCVICNKLVIFDQRKLELVNLIEVFCNFLSLNSSHYEDNFGLLSSGNGLFCMDCFDRMTSVSHLLNQLKLIQEELKELKHKVEEEIIYSFQASIKLRGIGNENDHTRNVQKIRQEICKDLSLLPPYFNVDEDIDKGIEVLNESVEVKKEKDDSTDADFELDESSFPNSPYYPIVDLEEKSLDLKILKEKAMKNDSILKLKRIEDFTDKEIEEALISASEPSVQNPQILNSLFEDEIPKSSELKIVKEKIRLVKKADRKRFILTCRVCLMKFHRAAEMKIHHLEAHDNKIIKCLDPNCPKMFRTIQRSRGHYRTVHEGFLKDSILCQICGKDVKRSSMNYHLQTHGERKPIKCFCNKVFICKNAYDKHFKSKHSSTETETYVCHTCGKVLASLKSLTNHEKQVHAKDFKIKCDLCDYGGQTMSKLRRHMYSHFEEKRYSCTEPGCEMKFKSAKGLTDHRFIHTGEKPYKCKTCGKGFRSTSQRGVHETIHTPHITTCACEICGKKFTHKAYLKLHVNWHKRVEARGNGPAKSRQRKPKELTKEIRQ